MLNLMHSVLRNARQARGPVIEKWEGFERYASLLLILAVAVLVGLVATGHFYGSLACLGGLLGLVIVGAYAAALAAKSTLAAVLSILVAVVGAASLVGRDSFPLWVLLSNGLSGLVLVVSATAAFTRTR